MDVKTKAGDQPNNKLFDWRKLTVAQITSQFSNEDSKVLYQGYICLRDWFDNDNEDQWCHYWAVIRAGHVFLFRNAQQSAICQKYHLLCQYYFVPMDNKHKWPKGMLYCKLRARNDTTVCLPEFSGDLELGWTSEYSWARHLRNSVGSPDGKSAALDAVARQRCDEALQAHRRLMMAIQADLRPGGTLARVNEAFIDDQPAVDKETTDDEFETPPMPQKLARPTAWNRLFQTQKSSNSYVETSSTLPRPSQAPPPLTREPGAQQPAPVDENIYDVASDLPVPDGLAESIYNEASDSGPTLTQREMPAAEADLATAEDSVYEDPTELQARQSRAVRDEEEEQQTYLTPDDTPQPAPRRPAEPVLPPKPQVLSKAPNQLIKAASFGSMAAMVTDGEPMDASVRYFYKAHQNPPGQAAEASVKLVNAPPGTFCLVGYSSGKPRKVFVLLVQTGQRVASYQVCEQGGGYRVMPSGPRHDTLNLLLYHHHLHELPTSVSNPDPGVRLARPADFDDKLSFHCAAAWTLGDRVLCQKLLSGTPNGTFAVVSDPATKRLFVYASQQGQVIKLPLESGAGLIWAEPQLKFPSLEELLEHYHHHDLQLNLAGSQHGIHQQLATPCQLSEQFARNIQRYLTQEIEEETREISGISGPVLVETRRLGAVTVRSESSSDMSLEPVPILQVKIADNYQYKGPVDVTPSQYRCFDAIFTVRRNPDMTFDSLEKLIMYVSSHKQNLR